MSTLFLRGCRVDLTHRVAHTARGAAHLSEQEAAVLAHLAAAAGDPVSRETLARAVWGGSVSRQSQAIPVAIRRLRDKIEPDPAAPALLLTVRGVGWRLLPPETVTLVFTRIHGAAALWERNHDAMQEAMRIHDAVLGALTGGHRVKATSAGWMMAFEEAEAAHIWCAAAQARLHSAPWPDALHTTEAAGAADGFRGLRVAMGVHTAVPVVRPDPETGALDYFGTEVSRAARICAAAHGGQVLFSEQARQLLAAPDALAPVGAVRLRGLSGTIALWQLSGTGRRFPPPQGHLTPTTAPSRDAFFAREAELTQLSDWLRGPARLVSLLGTGGIGKTRLAVELSDRLRDALPPTLCDLSAVHSERALLETVARSLGVTLLHRAGPDAARRQLAAALQGQGPTLLIFDNAEQISAACRDLCEALLAGAPATRLLVTSRERLHASAERILELEPLPVDDARALLCDRAGLPDSPRIARIAARLEGLPLAIELAAARARLDTLEAVEASLSAQLDALSAPDRDPRHATMRATITWSWAMLDDDERAVLAQCAVFRDGFSLEAAEVILDPGEAWPLDVLEALRDRSLLRAVDAEDGDIRLSMFETIRAFAAQKLAETGADRAVRQRHGSWFAEQGGEMLRRWRQGDLTGQRWMVQESGNLAAAVEGLADIDTALALRVAMTLHRKLLADSNPDHGLHILRLLRPHHSALDTADRARLLMAEAIQLHRSGRPGAAEAALDALDTRSLPPALAFQRLSYLSRVRLDHGQAAAALDARQEARALARAAGLPESQQREGLDEANILHYLGRFDEAYALVCSGQHGQDLNGQTAFLKLKVELEYERGDLAQSWQSLAQLEDAVAALDQTRWKTYTRHLRAYLVAETDPEEAAAIFTALQAGARKRSMWHHFTETGACRGLLLCQLGRINEAAAVFEAISTAGQHTSGLFRSIYEADRALLAVLRGQPTAATAHLREARHAAGDSWVGLSAIAAVEAVQGGSTAHLATLTRLARTFEVRVCQRIIAQRSST